MSEEDLKRLLNEVLAVMKSWRASHDNLAEQIRVLRECTAAMAATLDALWLDRFGCHAPAPTPQDAGKAN